MCRYFLLLVSFFIATLTSVAQEFQLTNGEVYLHEDLGTRMVTLGDKLTLNSCVSSRTIFRLLRTYDGKSYKSSWYEKCDKPTLVSELKKSTPNIVKTSDYNHIRGQRDTTKRAVYLQLVNPKDYQEYEIINGLHEDVRCCFEICNMSDSPLECILFFNDHDGIQDIYAPEKIKFAVEPQSITVLPQPVFIFKNSIKELILVSSGYFMAEEHELMCKLAKNDTNAFYDYINKFNVSVISF